MKDRFLFFIIILGTILFVPLFIFREIGPLDFWWWMSSNLLILLSLALIFDKSYFPMIKNDLQEKIPAKILTGLVSAVALYLVFFLGNYLSRLMYNFAGEGIEGVYQFKGDAPGIRIMILMALIIGPGEELFWRGYIQRHFETRFGRWGGFLLATAFYTGVHVFSGNPMLILAAFVAGLFWGWMFMKYKSMVMNIISHTVWDVAVFLIVPFS